MNKLLSHEYTGRVKFLLSFSECVGVWHQDGALEEKAVQICNMHRGIYKMFTGKVRLRSQMANPLDSPSSP